MRFLLAPEHYQEMRSRADHTPDCYVRPGQYLHHLYMDGVKYVVAPALAECLDDAVGRGDDEAVRHLQLHQSQYDMLATWLRARFGDSERGASLVEYALLVALIAVVCIAAVTLLGSNASSKFNKVGASIGQ